jgi:hypothetical protein
MNAVTTLKDLKTHNPFRGEGGDTPAPTGALARTDQARAVAEVQAALAIAKSAPRDPAAAVDRLLNACTRPTLAEVAVYQYARGGNDITGPSIRLAEAAAQCWGNLQYGIREVEQRDGASLVQAYAWDVESNTRREVIFSVPHTRHAKSGAYALTDPRDIYEAVANAGARRLRACILGIIPGDVIDAAVRQCEVTLRTKSDTGEDAIARMVDAFAAFDVTRAQIEARIQRRLDAITPAQIAGLKKIYVSLRDGMSAPGDWFGDAKAADPEPITQSTAPTPEPDPIAQSAPTEPTWPRQLTDPDTGEVGWQDSSGADYNEQRHGWNASAGRPSIKPDGTFRAKRGSSGLPPTPVTELSFGLLE